MPLHPSPRPTRALAIAFLLAVGWLSLGASNYWLGHLSQIFGGIFQFGSTATANVSSRVVGSASHRLIVDVRILLTLGLFFLAGIGALRRAASSRTLELLTVVPFFVLAGQSYGGEGLLRVAFLVGPFASLLAAAAILPSRIGLDPAVRALAAPRAARPHAAHGGRGRWSSSAPPRHVGRPRRQRLLRDVHESASCSAVNFTYRT